MSPSLKINTKNDKAQNKILFGEKKAAWLFALFLLSFLDHRQYFEQIL